MFKGKSWKTTGGGIGMILAALAHILAMITGNAEFSISAISADFMGITGGIALINAKDNNVTTNPTTGVNETIVK